ITDGAEMEQIPAGSFLAGSPAGEGSGNEHPRRLVYLDAFYIDRYEVTVGRYKNFVQATGHRPLPDWVSEHSPGDSHPVVGVSWEDAVAYATWAGKRLPTEAEWEYACCAGTETKYNVGESMTHDDANYSFEGGKDYWNKGTAPAGSFPPNRWGLYDMHGNVSEWCQDWYSRSYYKDSPNNNPTGPTEGSERVVRGGSWKNSAHNLRSANREYCRPTNTCNYVGFRCAK
ncbi:MAG: formylglycine-generating enzyme family protein, partial [Candidatus Hydrogenedentota bacterium]